MNGGCVEIRRGGDPAPVNESELLCECFEGSRHAIAAGTAKLDKVVRGGQGNQQPSVVAQDSAEFGRIHPCCDRKHDRE